MKLTTSILATIIALSAISFGCSSASNSNATAVKPATPSSAQSAVPTPTSAVVAPTPTDDAPRITLADAKAAYDSGDALIIDTRNDSAYQMEHIKGSINIPTGTLDANVGKLSKTKKMIVYCSCATEHTSAMLVSELQKRGYKNSFALVGGTKAWNDAGFPMQKAAAAPSPTVK